MYQIPVVLLPGNDLGLPELATDYSAGFDLPAVLTRACFDREGNKRFFCWKARRHLAWKEPVTPEGVREDYATVVDWLRAKQPVEVEKIKQLSVFPCQHLHLSILPGETVRVPLGIKTELPEPLFSLLFARASSASKDFRLGNSVGVIDADYRDEWFAAIKNTGVKPLVIRHGQRIVQAVLLPTLNAEWISVESLAESARSGGFGSTGDSPLSSLPLDEAGVPVVYDEELNTPVSGDSESATVAESSSIYLVCGNVQVGPIAKFRGADYESILAKDNGEEMISSMLLREIQQLVPKAVPKLVSAILAERRTANDVPENSSS